ncbi:hypothetical protein SAMN04488564_1021078 [Lentzea waywayandensis]|uniref:Excreted virulence factor EspC, type VII ESX diderm n=1 Tax=Lentzea waywayandensis TaxID=84724 RepID=A0A1I6DN33_9PSEU|nr:hypothetical protein [Lentzea waywayandensis]SFR06791.1 hypothetical protein SAMN04488564_1021078 [Lentzea waywayandensis]
MSSFAVEVENLVDAAKVMETHIAGSFESVHHWIKGATEKENDAFYSGDGQGGRHLYDQVGDEWRVTADFMNRIAVDNAETMRLAAEALREIAQRYREADGQA